MVKSMTGYGRGEAVVHGRSITVELRSVNNRYLDCTIKLPRIYVFAEDAIKSKVQAHISRGKVDVFVTIGPSENGDVSISVNKPVADGYYAALCALRDSYGLKDDISVSLLSRFQDVFLVEKTQEDLEAVSADICSVLELALQDFDAGGRKALPGCDRPGTHHRGPHYQGGGARPRYCGRLPGPPERQNGGGASEHPA